MKTFAMTARRGRPLFVLAFGMTLGATASPAAWAQVGPSPGGYHPNSMGGARAAPDKPPEPPPDAIPGAKPREAPAPATRSAADMQPTEALFDAINRGDIAGTRDALNRGADMNGVNILGMTPMELSVDLGRNDISFLLLSMRGDDSDRGSRALGRDASPSTPTGKTAQAEKPAGRGRTAQGKAVPGKAAQAANTPVAPKPIATPKLFANDGGTPLPSAGFLGFDSRSASN
jgi:hypothetical protein